MPNSDVQKTNRELRKVLELQTKTIGELTLYLHNTKQKIKELEEQVEDWEYECKYQKYYEE